jgi:hypothetical protein
MIIMFVFLIITVLFGYILNLLWAVGLGLFWGIGGIMVYYVSQLRKGAERLNYAIQAILSFAVIIAFVSLQGIYGPHPQLFDIFVLAFTAAFIGGMLMLPFYKYLKLKAKASAESDLKTSPNLISLFT